MAYSISCDHCLKILSLSSLLKPMTDGSITLRCLNITKDNETRLTIPSYKLQEDEEYLHFCNPTCLYKYLTEILEKE